MQAKWAVMVLAMAWLLAAGVGLASPDQEFFGVVEARPAKGYYGEWIIGGKKVKVSPRTEFDFRGGEPQVGTVVKVQGRWSEDVFLARELKTRRDERGRGRGRR
jgi:hypothetical protein